MKIGIIGLPQVGKKTLFWLLTNHRPSEKELISNKPIKGICEIKDGRFDKLVSIYRPKKQARAKIEIEAFPKLGKETLSKGEIFADTSEIDALCHCVRAFKDESVYHASGSIDPRRDAKYIASELILYDLVFVEKRLERLEQKIEQTKEEFAVKEKEALVKLKSHLEKELPLRLVDLTSEEKKAIASYPLITLKPVIIVLNISEEDLKSHTLIEEFGRRYKGLGIEVMQVSAKLESEIAALATEEERLEFLKELGIEESAINALTRSCLKALDLISFFTVVEDEVRQWTIRAGSTAPEAAGAIHSDLKKGFIRAEVVKYSDLEALGSEMRVKEAGKFYIKGKDYIVEDGDIIHIRFNL